MSTALLAQRCFTVALRARISGGAPTAASANTTCYSRSTPHPRRLQYLAAAQDSVSGTMSTPILIYFDVPARGEISRLCFTLGGVDFKEKLIPVAEWPAFKPKTPFGQVPLLQIGDTVITQSAAIDHYAARAGGFIPEDPIQELLSDQAYYFVTQDLHSALLSPTMKMPADEAVEMRKELAAGALKDRLALLDKLVASRSGRFIAGDKLSVGDFAIFNFLGMIKSEFWPGIPASLLDNFDALKSYRNEVANEPGVKSYYDKATLDLRIKGYRPDEAA